MILQPIFPEGPTESRLHRKQMQLNNHDHVNLATRSSCLVLGNHKTSLSGPEAICTVAYFFLQGNYQLQKSISSLSYNCANIKTFAIYVYKNLKLS